MFNENVRNSYKSMHSFSGRDNQKLGISRYVTRSRWIKSEILHSYLTREFWEVLIIIHVPLVYAPLPSWAKFKNQIRVKHGRNHSVRQAESVKFLARQALLMGTAGTVRGFRPRALEVIIFFIYFGLFCCFWSNFNLARFGALLGQIHLSSPRQ